jgi:stress response protein YsnF
MPEQERQPTPEDLRIPLHAEEVTVSRREIKTAEVHIALVTGTHEQLVDEELTRVRVEIERIPIGRTVEVVPPVREEEDTTVIPVVEEIVVVERRLVLKEEVRIRRVSTKERHRESVVLREQEAVITRKEVAGQPDRVPPTAPRVEPYPNPKGEKS